MKVNNPNIPKVFYGSDSIPGYSIRIRKGDIDHIIEGYRVGWEEKDKLHFIEDNFISSEDLEKYFNKNGVITKSIPNNQYVIDLDKIKIINE